MPSIRIGNSQKSDQKRPEVENLLCSTDHLCVTLLFYSSFEAETLNAFSMGLDVCTVVSGPW